MQKHRIFIAINLPDKIKNSLVKKQEEIKKLFSVSLDEEEFPRNGIVGWIKAYNLHITLDFIGYVNNDDLLKVSKIVKEVAVRSNPFLVRLGKICYGPLASLPAESGMRAGPINRKQPKMVWSVGQKSKEFAFLRDDLENSLSDFPENRQNLSLNKKERKFSPHVTLGRIRQWEWKRIDPEERPIIDENINLSFSVNSIEIMESVLKKKGAEYTTLESVQLG